MSECPHCGSDGDHPSIGVDYWGDDEYRCADCQGEWSDPSRYEADQLAASAGWGVQGSTDTPESG